MRTWRVAMAGFGNVGQGFTEILRDHGDRLSDQFGLQLRIVAVSDIHRGSLCDPDGLDPRTLLSAIQDTGHLRDVPAPFTGWDTRVMIAESRADVVAELTYTDLTSGEPALSHILQALELGKHVVTTNKGPVALHYAKIERLARSRNAELGVEGTVMSGTPAIRMGRELLRGAGIQRVQGIFNGTTNFILTRMEDGRNFQDALAEAQSKGYAEADPTGDVEGFDAAAKVVIMANLLLDAQISMTDVERRGITELNVRDVDEARASGKCWKLIGSIETDGGQINARVLPTLISLDHPLAGVRGATNAIVYSTELLGDVTLIGPGAGRRETGYALLCDLLAIHNHSPMRRAPSAR